MIPTNRHRQLSLPDMGTNDIRNSPAHLRHQAGVLQDPNRRVLLRVDLFELVVPVKVDLPTEGLELVNEPCVDEVDGTLVHARFGLRGMIVR